MTAKHLETFSQQRSNDYKKSTQSSTQVTKVIKWDQLISRLTDIETAQHEDRVRITDRIARGTQSTTIIMNEDNQGSIALAQNPEDHPRTKHIDVRLNFIRAHVHQRLYTPSVRSRFLGATSPWTCTGTRTLS